MGKRDLVALLSLSSLNLVMFVLLFLAVPWGCLWLVIVVFPDHTHLLFLPISYQVCPNMFPLALSTFQIEIILPITKCSNDVTYVQISNLETHLLISASFYYLHLRLEYL